MVERSRMGLLRDVQMRGNLSVNGSKRVTPDRTDRANARMVMIVCSSISHGIANTYAHTAGGKGHSFRSPRTGAFSPPSNDAGFWILSIDFST